MSRFELHPRLAADTFRIDDWPLARVLLMNDARFPWIVLVPRRAGVVEIFDLNEEDQVHLMGEIAQAARRLKASTSAAKINVGALGNLVPQLHIHVVGRNASDAAWPGPVWGHGAPVPYAGNGQTRLIEAFVNAA